ncbi:MAG TPA: amidohydrolase family protein [Dongiaceae bacterium]|nr:amidohydrolase family protein [Dongiaceae bacterium]
MTPGAVNAHTHLYSALAPFGLPVPSPAPASFPEILRAVWWRLDRALDERALVAGARLHAGEALLAGTTTLVDHHESPGMIEGSLELLADACDTIGIRAVLCYGATERNGGREEAEAGLGECRRFLLANRRPRVRGVVGLHASFTVSDDTVRESGRLCAELGTVLHTHLAEDRCDLDDARARGHAGPLERLFDLGALPPGSILAHGVLLDTRQVERCERAGVWLVQNPRSNRANRVGFATAVAAGTRVALGTDGFPSDLMAEAAALGPPGRDEPRGQVAAATLGVRLAAGRALAAERFAPATLAGDQVWWRGGRVARVTVDGRPVVEFGKLVYADLEELRARAREAAPSVWRRMERLPWPS